MGPFKGTLAARRAGLRPPSVGQKKQLGKKQKCVHNSELVYNLKLHMVTSGQLSTITGQPMIAINELGSSGRIGAAPVADDVGAEVGLASFPASAPDGIGPLAVVSQAASDGAAEVNPSLDVPSGPGTRISKPVSGPFSGNGSSQSALDILKSERSTIQARISKLMKSRQALGDADLRLWEIEAEARLLDDDAAARLSAWASNGSEGSPPALDDTRTTDCATRLVAAQSHARAAQQAITGIDEQSRELNARLVDIDGQIGAEVLTALEAEFEAFHSGLMLDVAELSKRVAGPGHLHLAEQILSRLRFRLCFSESELNSSASEWRDRAGGNLPVTDRRDAEYQNGLRALQAKRKAFIQATAGRKVHRVDMPEFDGGDGYNGSGWYAKERKSANIYEQARLLLAAAPAQWPDGAALDERH